MGWENGGGGGGRIIPMGEGLVVRIVGVDCAS